MQTQIHTAVNNGTASEKLFDLCMIENLCHGNQQNVKKMLKVFVEQIPAAVEDIKVAYRSTDFNTIKKTAHRIKPVLRYYAIIKIEKDIEQIEVLAEEGLPSGELEQRINRVATVIGQVAAQMKNNILY